MYKNDVISYYGSTTKVANVLSIVQSSVSQWGEVIPQLQAFRLHRITQGQLQYRNELYEPGTASSCDTKSA